jgi:hypothetical protein
LKVIRVANKIVCFSRTSIYTSLTNILFIINPVIVVLVVIVVILGHIRFLIEQLITFLSTGVTIIGIHSAFFTLGITFLTFSIRYMLSITTRIFIKSVLVIHPLLIGIYLIFTKITFRTGIITIQWFQILKVI